MVPNRPATKKHHSMELQLVGALGAADTALLFVFLTTRRRRLLVLRAGADDGVMRGPDERPRRGAPVVGTAPASAAGGDRSREFMLLLWTAALYKDRL